MMKVEALLEKHLHLFKKDEGSVLDLACGKGQNGLFLDLHHIDTLFADINKTHLDNLVYDYHIDPLHCWVADFEDNSQLDANKLRKMQLQGIIVFRYLHRPLLSAIKQAIKPGGILIYETFTIENKQFGRPHREQFLLKTGELKAAFLDWEILFYFEGVQHSPDRATAQIVCIKPLQESSHA